MDFTPREPTHSTPQMPHSGPALHQPPHPNHQAPVRPPRKKHINWEERTVRIELFILLVGIALLLGALSLYLGFSANNSTSEFDKVSKDKYQAVFLNGGISSGSVVYSTYFGHIVKLNSQYLVLQNVFFLTNDQSSQNGQSAPQLSKLGCQQLHAPYDEMIINRNQIAFWENLQDSGKVTQGIQQYQQSHPNGPDCNAQPNSNSTQNSGSSTQNNTSTQSNQKP